MADYLMEVVRWMSFGLVAGLVLGETLARPIVLWHRRRQRPRSG